MPGIVQTKIGFLGGAEIVEATYDPRKVTVKQMVQTLKKHRSFHALHTNQKALRKRASRYLGRRELKPQRGRLRFIKAKHTLRTRHPDLYYLPLTEAQAMKLNSWSYFGGAFPDVLTRSQRALRLRLQKKLKRRRPRSLRPSRRGKGRLAYQKQLLVWLSQ